MKIETITITHNEIESITMTKDELREFYLELKLFFGDMRTESIPFIQTTDTVINPYYKFTSSNTELNSALE